MLRLNRATKIALAVITLQPQWMPQLTPVDARLRGISAVSEKVAWASVCKS